MMDNLKAEAEVFRLAATRFEIDEESLISTLHYLGNKLNELGANVNDVAVQFGVSRSFATRILEGTAKPDEIAAWRASAVAHLVQDVYHDIDSYRNGLLCCQIDDPPNSHDICNSRFGGVSGQVQQESQGAQYINILDGVRDILAGSEGYTSRN